MGFLTTVLVALRFRAGAIAVVTRGPAYRVRVDTETTHRTRVETETNHRVRSNINTTHRVRVDEI